jgi:type I restriction enzyme S subunit
VIATHDEALFDEPVLLIGRVGASGAINRTSGRAWVSDNAYVVSWEGSVSDIDFLEASLRDARLDQFASKSAQPLLSQEKLARAEIGFGSSQAQIEFGAMARRASELRDHLFSHLTITDELFRSLQHRAFTEWL